MMKYLLYTAVACFVFAGCTGNSNAPDYAVVNDTFDYYGDNLITALPAGFMLDTIQRPGKENYYHETVIAPRLTNAVYGELNSKLQEEIVRIKDSDIVPADEAGKDTAKLVEDTSETNVTIAPLTIYKTQNLISYSFLNFMFAEGMMRPFRRYFAVNYNTEQNRFINFDDYFIVTGAKDSALLKRIIYGDIGNPDLSWYSLGNHIVFSSDKYNVYFHFDMFGFLQNPMGITRGVKKKYIQQFIRKEYK